MDKVSTVKNFGNLVYHSVPTGGFGGSVSDKLNKFLKNTASKCGLRLITGDFSLLTKLKEVFEFAPKGVILLEFRKKESDKAPQRFEV